MSFSENAGSWWITWIIADFSNRAMTESVMVDRRYKLRLPGKTSLAEEFLRSKNCDSRFLA
jgi:hypothetical protein